MTTTPDVLLDDELLLEELLDDDDELDEDELDEEELVLLAAEPLDEELLLLEDDDDDGVSVSGGGCGELLQAAKAAKSTRIAISFALSHITASYPWRLCRAAYLNSSEFACSRQRASDEGRDTALNTTCQCLSLA